MIPGKPQLFGHVKLATFILLILHLNPGKTDMRTRKLGSGMKRYNSKIQENINTVSLTQKGYIQFLRYIVDVPEIRDFTFCIWLKSENLTHSHPLFSYSGKEEKRYIRSWISPGGNGINFEILDKEVFKLPARFKINRWFHVCKSFSSTDGFWAFYVNGKLKHSGYQPELQGSAIPAGGDIVIGQEYTDFDKGLDDGIEGQIFGFNLVLSSTGPQPANLDLINNNYLQTQETDLRRILTIPVKAPEKIPADVKEENDEIPAILNYFTSNPANRQPKGLYEYFFGSFLPVHRRILIKTPQDVDMLHVRNDRGEIITIPTRFKTPAIWNHVPIYENSSPYNIHNRKSPVIMAQNKSTAKKRIITNSPENDGGEQLKSLGSILVELSSNCVLGKGAPLSEDKVLISWTKTPVRVFGGAILNNIRPFCLKNF